MQGEARLLTSHYNPGHQEFSVHNSIQVDFLNSQAERSLGHFSHSLQTGSCQTGLLVSPCPRLMGVSFQIR